MYAILLNAVQMEITKIKLDNQDDRYLLDSYEKIIYWIKQKFKEQKNTTKGTSHKRVSELTIDLSNTVIKLNRNEWFWFGPLCGKVDGVVNLGKKEDVEPNERGGVIVKNELQFSIKYKIDFSNSIIYSARLFNTEFLKYVSFSNVKIFGGANFEGSIFYKPVSFANLDISQIYDKNHEIIENVYSRIDMSNITFNDKVSFICVNWKDSTQFHFNNNILKGKLEFILCSMDCSPDWYYDFTNNTFEDDVFIDGRQNKGEKTRIISNVDFGGSYFYKKLKIWSMQLGHIDMQNCHFYNTVNITTNIYDQQTSLNFAYSTIKSLFFIDSDLGDYKGDPIELSNEISFYKTLIKEDAFIFLRNINNTKVLQKNGFINFEYANILGNITIQDSKLEQIKFRKSTLTGNINIEDVDCTYDCRESIIKIKNGFIKNHDVVNSLIYRAKEMKFYSEHLGFKCKLINLVLSWFISNWFGSIIGLLFLPLMLIISIIPTKSLDKTREYTLLYFNRISNYFGMSWGQGVLFTCITASIFFGLINYYGLENYTFFEWGWDGWNSFGIVWSNYLKVLNVLNFKDNLEGVILNPIGETLFFLSKIFIAFGIYQTISAFRKYGKL